MLKHKIIAAVAVTSVFGLAACSGSSSDQKNDTVTTLMQKNAALPQSTAARTVTTPMPQTTTPKTVTTPKPKLGSPGPTFSPRPSVTYKA